MLTFFAQPIGGGSKSLLAAIESNGAGTLTLFADSGGEPDIVGLIAVGCILFMSLVIAIIGGAHTRREKSRAYSPPIETQE